MLKIKLTRIGKKHEPNFRVVLVEARTKPKPSRYVDLLGNYNPAEKRINLNKEKIKNWIAKGAKTSETVHNLLVKEGVISAPKIKKHSVNKKRAEQEETQKQTNPEQD